MAPKKMVEPPAVEVDFSGLAESWEKNESIRHGAFAGSSLLTWGGDPKKIGLVNMPSLKFNCAVVTELMKLYLPQVPDGKTCYVDPVKEQVRVSASGIHLQKLHCHPKQGVSPNRI